MASQTISRRVLRLMRRAANRQPVGLRPTVPGSLIELARSGPAPLVSAARTPDGPLRIATVIPTFRRGSGGHGTIVNLMRQLVARGHSVSLWLEDFERSHVHDSAVATQRRFAEFFDARDLQLQPDFSRWRGADVVLATGWQTVPRVLLLGDVAARAYLVQDHEPAFYGASAEALFAADTYQRGLHCIAASQWLAELLRTRYGASVSHFDLGVDHRVYRPAANPRSEDLVAFYARASTPRRAVPLGLLALEELARRRPEISIALFGSDRPAPATFAHNDMGVLAPAELAALFRRARIGVAFSLTNPSLTALEMMACGLPCVELASESIRASFGDFGPLRLTAADPLSACSAIEALLDDHGERERLAGAGKAFVESRTWSAAAEQVEQALRYAIARSR